MVRRHHSGNQRLKTKTHGRFNRRVNKARKRRLELSGNKSELFISEIVWIGHKIDQNSIRPFQDKLLAIKKLKEPENGKELKAQSSAYQNISKTSPLKPKI